MVGLPDSARSVIVRRGPVQACAGPLCFRDVVLWVRHDAFDNDRSTNTPTRTDPEVTGDPIAIDAVEARAAGGLTVPQLDVLEREYGNVEAAIEARPDLADLLRQAQRYWQKQAESWAKWSTVIVVEEGLPVLEKIAATGTATDAEEEMAVRGIADPGIERFTREQHEKVRRVLRTKARLREVPQRLHIARHVSRAWADAAPRRAASTSRARPRGRRVAVRAGSASRDGPDPPEPEPPGEPPDVATFRGFWTANVRMVRHCARRRAKAAA